MSIKLTPVEIESTPPAEFECDLLAVTVAGDDSAIAAAVGEAAGVDLLEVASEEGFKGEKGQTKLFRGLSGLGTRRVLLVGIGDDDAVAKGSVRTGFVKAGKTAGKIKAKHVALATDDPSHAQQAIEGFHFGAYKFDKHVKRDEETFVGHSGITVLGDVSNEVVDAANGYASGVYQARNLGNEAPNILYPAHMAEIAVDIASEVGLEHEVYDESRLVAEEIGRAHV